MLNIRDLTPLVTPTWLRKGIAAKLFQAFTLLFDSAIELATAAVELRFPGVYSDESLAPLSRERRIRQGIGESNSAFAVRLAGYLDAHKDRGGPYPMLEQIWRHYKSSPAGPFPVHLIYASGARFDMASNGVVTRNALAFSSALPVAAWAHWWLVYEWPVAVLADGTWGSAGVWGDGGVWGSNMTPDQITDIRVIPNEWNNAYCRGTISVLSPGLALWGAPLELWGAGGTWGDGIGSVVVQVEI